jgi:hypothetical protein
VQRRYEGIAWYVSAIICETARQHCKTRDLNPEGLGTCLSVFNSDRSKNVIRIANAIQRWNVAFICVIQHFHKVQEGKV